MIRGLIRKDFYLIWNEMRFSIFILWILPLFISFWAGPSAIAAFPVLLTMSVASTVAYDDKAGWNQYLRSVTPAAYRVIASKYLLAGASILAGAILSFPLGCLSCVITGKPITFEILGIVCGAAAAAVLVFTVLFPLCLKFGAERGRLLFAAVFLILFLAICLVIYAIEYFSYFESEHMLAVLPVALLLLVLGAVAISFSISIKIWDHKE